MSENHEFVTAVLWTGNRGEGTSSHRDYDRTWSIVTDGKPVLPCSNDPRLGGDASLHNPEDLLVSALSSCHMLWYLHLASRAGIVVTAYCDEPIGVGESDPDGTGRFVEAVLRPRVRVREGTDLQRAEQIHHEIHRHCFIARSINFPVRCEPSFESEPAG